MQRNPRTNEVANLASGDGKVVFSIVERQDGFYEFYVDEMQIDLDGDKYWSKEGFCLLYTSPSPRD